jgi:hypothetical protein
VAALNSYARQYSDLDNEQRLLLRTINGAKESLEQEADSRLHTDLPEIAEQNRTAENIEKRVETARAKLAEQSDMV